MLRDDGRIDPFADDGRTRELSVWIWYPAVEGVGPAATYLPPNWTAFVNNVGPLYQDLTSIRTNSIANASLEGRPKVVVLLPGLGQPVASYSALAEDLASHGYAVIGINPTGSTEVVFPDGHVVGPTALGGIDEGLITDMPGWYVSAERVTNVWATDVEFVIRTLAADAPQIGALDFSHVAHIGHSLGGAAAFEACDRDEFCAGAVDLDGTLWTELRHDGLQVPTLILRHASDEECDMFCHQAMVDFANVMAAGNSQQFSIAGSKHLSFTDLGLLPSPGNNEVYRGTIDPERMIVATRDIVRSFLDVHLLDAPATTLAATIARYPELHRE